MQRETKRAIIATLIKAGREDLANVVRSWKPPKGQAKMAEKALRPDDKKLTELLRSGEEIDESEDISSS